MKVEFFWPFALVVVVLAILVFTIAGWVEECGSAVLVPEDPPHVIVRSGDTIWAIARREFPQPTAKWVHRIQELNPGVDPGRIQPGQKLWIPEEVGR